MKQLKPKVAVITVNYNNASMTGDCIRSIEKNTGKDVDVSIIVVDNGSKEEASKKLYKQFKDVKFIYSKKNLGFAGGNNLGIKEAIKQKNDYVLLINNDAEITEPGFIAKLIKNNKGISAPVVTFTRNDEIIYDYGGKIDKLFGRNTHYESPFTIEDFYPEADYYSGVCLLIDTKVFSKIGLLDESFFLYYEDVDFCLRAKQAGFKQKLCPDASIIHKLSASTNKLGKGKIKILADSHFNFCLKHLPPMSTPFFLTFNVYLRLKSYN